ncbi:MAG: ferritin family protein [Candidatus Bathyarchaeia archaeon]
MAKYGYTRSVLLEMAVAVENSAKDFYLALSEKIPEREALFENLANDEEEHARIYKQLLSRPGVYSTEEDRMLADFNIKVLEDLGVISNLRRGAERARKISHLKSAIDVAVQLEKDTALFYSNMAMELGIEDRQEIYKIIQTEYSHMYKVQHITL